MKNQYFDMEVKLGPSIGAVKLSSEEMDQGDLKTSDDSQQEKSHLRESRIRRNLSRSL